MFTNFRSRSARYGLASAAVVALAVPTALVGTAGPASAAAACGVAGPYKDGTIVDQTAGVSANIRTGSSTSCGVRGYADNQDTLLYYCYTRNSSGSTWTYLWDANDNKYGWVSDSLLPGNGSNYSCGF